MGRVLKQRPMGNNVHRNIQQWLTRKLGIYVTMTTDQINDLDQIYIVVRRQLKKPVCVCFFSKTFASYTSIYGYFRFPHFTTMETVSFTT